MSGSLLFRYAKSKLYEKSFAGFKQAAEEQSMLNIIESNKLPGHKPGGHDFHKSQINLLLRFLKKYQKFTFPFEERATAGFVIGDYKERGVFGGAILYPQKTCAPRVLSFPLVSEGEIEKSLLALQPGIENFWTARFCLFVHEKTLDLSGDFAKFHEDFYKRLLKYLIVFAKAEGLEFLPLTLQARDYTNTKTYGWTYALEIEPRKSSDRLFHGLLAIHGKKYKASSINQQLQHSEKQVPANGQEPTDWQVQ